VFQGNLLISSAYLSEFWPSASGTSVFLCDCEPGEVENVSNEIQRTFRDYGADLIPASEKLAGFNSVENTYLAIFLVMGALAMLLGTIGLGIILARNLQERKAEIYLLRACGIPRSRITGMLFTEYFLLLAAGLAAGGIPAVISILPNILNPASGISAGFLLAIIAVLFLNGMGWIYFLTRAALYQKGTQMIADA
jgi:ABC-type antimicrobial peptide transport system permease subunit